MDFGELMNSTPVDPGPVNPVIPFGEYAGEFAGDVDDVRYLDWLLGFVEGQFQADLKKHLESRADWKSL